MTIPSSIPAQTYKPEHEQVFPKKEQPEEGGIGSGESMPVDESTTTPDLLMKKDGRKSVPDRSERIATGEHIVPAHDETEWVQPDEDAFH